MRVGRTACAITVLVAVAACSDAAPVSVTASSSSPLSIVNGDPTGRSYSNVGALLFDFDANGKINGDDEWCTGSLVAADVFLTAAHCIVTPFTPAGKIGRASCRERV